MLPKDEYAQLCSEIRTWNANKIPLKGLIFCKNHLYAYTHGKYSHRIICVEKIEIEGNEDYIAKAFKEAKR